MKNKDLKKLTRCYLFTLLAAVLSVFCFSQTPTPIDDSHKKISTQYHTVMESARLITNGASKTKDDFIKNVTAAKTGLQQTKKEKENLIKIMPKKYKVIAEPFYTSIEKYQIEAEQNAASLTEELKNKEPNQGKIIEYAKKLHGSAEKAEREHLSLKEKTKS